MNRYIVGAPSSGKTKEMLQMAKDLDAVVICRNPEAMRVKAQNYGLFRMEFYGYNEIEDLREGRNVVIDELGEFFLHGLNLRLDGFNMSVENG